MAHELENIEKLDEEFKAHIKEIQLYFKTFKLTNYGIYEVLKIFLVNI